MAFLFIALLVLFVFFAGAVVVFGAAVRMITGAMPAKAEPLVLPPKLGWGLLIAIAALNVFAYKARFGIGAGLFGASLFASILVVLPPQKRTREAWFLAVAGTVFCLLFGVRGNEFVQAVNVAAALGCGAALVVLASVDTIRWHLLWLFRMAGAFVLRLTQLPSALGARVGKRSGEGKSRLPMILVTIGLTLGVLGFFTVLLSAADPVFERLFREIREQLVNRALLSGVLTAGLVALLSVSVPRALQERVPGIAGLGFTEMFVPAVSLALLFGLFLGVQARYLFAGQAAFAALNITYAEYVRKGFLELLAASAAACAIVYALNLKRIELRDPAQARKLAWITVILLAEVLLLLASAFRRDLLYIGMYGLTRVRIAGVVFLGWLLGVLAILFAATLSRRPFERSVLPLGVVISVITVLVLNGMNMDGIIASTISPRTGRIDPVYVSMLSSDAVEGWIAALDEAAGRYNTLRTKTAFTDQEKTLLAEARVAAWLLNGKFLKLEAARPLRDETYSWMTAQTYVAATDRNPYQQATCVADGIRTLQLSTNTELSDLEQRAVRDIDPGFIERPDYWQPSLQEMQRNPAYGGKQDLEPCPPWTAYAK